MDGLQTLTKSMKDVSLWCMHFEIRASIESSYFFSTEANIFLINH